MSMLGDDGQIKLTWLLDRLGRPQTNKIAPYPAPWTNPKSIPKPACIISSSVQPSESSSAPQPDPGFQSQVRESGEVDDIFCLADSDPVDQEESWYVFLSAINGRFGLE
jgi:hypothetical protein